jgi:predicted GIY-YIG superfamily endonuclease
VKEIYALLEPGTRQIRYVGVAQSAKARVKSHWKQRGSTYRSPVKDWLVSLSSAPAYEILQIVEDEYGFQAEEYWTAMLRQIDTVALLNRRDGWSVRPETRVRISDTTRGKPSNFKGHTHTEAQRQVISKRMTGRKLSAQTREKVRKASLCRECKRRIVRVLGV